MTRSVEQLELIARVADGFPCGVWVAEVPSGALAYANRRFAEIMGMAALDGVSVGEYAAPYGIHGRDGALYPEHRMPYVRALEAGRAIVADDIVIHRHDGRKVYVRAEATPLRDPAGTISHVVIAFFEITREVEAELARQESESRLARAQRMESIGQLAGGIAHDFNNLLGTTRTLASTLRLTESDPSRMEALRLIDQVAQTGAQLTRSLLGFARRGKHLAARADVNEVVRGMQDMFSRTMGRGIEVRFHLCEGPAEVVGDVSQLEQVLLNLVLNARDATPDGGRIDVSTRLEVLDHAQAEALGTVAAGRWVLLEVADNGSGIDPAIRHRIFEPYFTTKTSGPHLGTGLGLATVDGITSAHGGSVEVLPAEPRGTIMRVRLPAAEAAARAKATPRPEPVRASHAVRRGSGKVLAADDDPLLRGALDAALRALGYDPVLVANGPELVARFRESPKAFAAVMLDLLMPGPPARETFEALRAIAPAVPVLLMTGFARNEQVQELLDAGVRGFVPKPFSAESLSEALAVLRAPPTEAESR